MLVDEKPRPGDIVRGLVGIVSITGVMAILYDPGVQQFFPMLAAFSVVLLVCIFTARSKAGVAGGIGAFVLLRVVLGLLLYVARRL